jgi:hypothetical protein
MVTAVTGLFAPKLALSNLIGSCANRAWSTSAGRRLNLFRRWILKSPVHHVCTWKDSWVCKKAGAYMTETAKRTVHPTAALPFAPGLIDCNGIEAPAVS